MGPQGHAVCVIRRERNGLEEFSEKRQPAVHSSAGRSRSQRGSGARSGLSPAAAPGAGRRPAHACRRGSKRLGTGHLCLSLAPTQPTSLIQEPHAGLFFKRNWARPGTRSPGDGSWRTPMFKPMLKGLESLKTKENCYVDSMALLTDPDPTGHST